MADGVDALQTTKYAERYVSRGEHKLYVRDFAGEGPAFVLMHGFPDNLQIYNDLTPKLAAAGRRVIAFDFLGYGKSDKPTEYHHTALSMMGDLETVVDGLD